MSGKPNSGAEILDNLQGVMSDAQMGRGDLTYIGAPKSKKRERDLSAYTAVAALIAENYAKDACLTMIHAELQYHAPWPESDDMGPADKIMFGLGLLVRNRDALIAERDALVEVHRAFERQARLAGETP